MDAVTYFRTADRATAAVRIPAEFEAPHTTLVMSGDRDRSRFSGGEPRFARGQFHGTCSRGQLSEVRICLTRTLAPDPGGGCEAAVLSPRCRSVARAEPELAAQRSLMTNDAPSQVPRAATELPLQRHWWVNHRRSDRAEVDELPVVARRRTGTARGLSRSGTDPSGAGRHRVLVRGGRHRAIGLVLERARSASMVRVFEVAGACVPADDGWLVPVRFVALAEPLRPQDHMAAIKPLLPHRQSPLRASGQANQHVQLTELLRRWPTAATAADAASGGLRGAHWHRTGRQACGRCDRGAALATPDIAPAERRQLISARVGQGIFRERVSRPKRRAASRGILDRRYLRADPHQAPGRTPTIARRSMASTGCCCHPIFITCSSAATFHLPMRARC